MKKIILSVALALFVCAPLLKVNAQVKVDVEGYKKKIEASNEDIANPKKNTKAATWLNRGKLFLDVFGAPNPGIYTGIDDKTAIIMFGKPLETSKVKFAETEYTTLKYANFMAYALPDGAGGLKIESWEPTVTITENPLEKSSEAYMKAYELDKSAAQKVAAGQKMLGDAYKELASNNFTQAKYIPAADAFAKAYEIQIAAPGSKIDTLALFNAGFLYTVALDYPKGEKYLTKALEIGSEKDGDTYYYLYFCYNGQKNEQAAKDILLKGLAKYPNNSNIVEGLLVLYTSGDNNPADIIPLVQKAIDNDPKNAALYSGMGLIYNKMKNYDGAIEAFKKNVELAPDDFNGYFNLGLVTIQKADDMNAENAKAAFTTTQAFNDARDTVIKVYGESIAPLEKAHQLNPQSEATVELLKNVSFRLRDEPGMMDKYNKYNDLFKKMTGAQ